jgi:hypothetical protein
MVLVTGGRNTLLTRFQCACGVPRASEGYPRPAAQLKISRFSGDQLRRRFGIALLPCKDGLSFYLAEMRAREQA